MAHMISYVSFPCSNYERDTPWSIHHPCMHAYTPFIVYSIILYYHYMYSINMRFFFLTIICSRSSQALEILPLNPIAGVFSKAGWSMTSIVLTLPYLEPSFLIHVSTCYNLLRQCYFSFISFLSLFLYLQRFI